MGLPVTSFPGRPGRRGPAAAAGDGQGARAGRRGPPRGRAGRGTEGAAAASLPGFIVRPILVGRGARRHLVQRRFHSAYLRLCLRIPIPLFTSFLCPTSSHFRDVFPFPHVSASLGGHCLLTG